MNARIMFAILLLAAAGNAQAAIKTETVDYKHGDVELQGVLVYDDSADGKRPGIVVVHEWWGRGDYEVRRATELAKLGYVAFAIDMFGKGKRTDDPKQAGEWAGAFYKDRQLARDRAGAGLDALKKSDRVDASKIAAIGYCFGGSTVLEMARGGAGVRGVVSFHGGLESTAPAKSIGAKVLVETGGDDPMVPSEQVAKFEQEMRDAKADWQVHVHGGAQHSFTNPEADTRGIKGIKYDEKADRRSWEAMKSFFAELFQ